MNSPLVIEQVRTVVNRDVSECGNRRGAEGLPVSAVLPAPAERRRSAGGERRSLVQPSVPSSVDAAAAAGRGRRGGPPPQALPPAQPLWCARRGRRGRGPEESPPPLPRLPLNRWQEYAHALLLTNRLVQESLLNLLCPPPTVRRAPCSRFVACTRAPTPGRLRSSSIGSAIRCSTWDRSGWFTHRNARDESRRVSARAPA